MGKNQDPDPGYTARIIFRRAWKTFFGVKNLKFFVVDPGSGMEKIRIRDLGSATLLKSSCSSFHLARLILNPPPTSVYNFREQDVVGGRLLHRLPPGAATLHTHHHTHARQKIVNLLHMVGICLPFYQATYCPSCRVFVQCCRSVHISFLSHTDPWIRSPELRVRICGSVILK
jgi:hypothetical protein